MKIFQHCDFISIPILILSFTAVCHLSHAKVTQLPLSYYCNDVLDHTAFELVADDANTEVLLHQVLYDVVYELRVPRDRCTISRNHSLSIGFKQITKVSGVLIDETAFGTKNLNFIKVSLRRGRASFQCNYAGKIIEFSNGNFANFSCLLNDHPHHFSNGVPANSIEISSVKSEISVNLSNLKAVGSFGWLFLSQPTTVNENPQADRCLPPGLYPGQALSPEKQFYHIGEIVSFSCPDDFVLESWDAQRTCQGNGIWSANAPICQPKRQWWESIIVVSFDQLDKPHNRVFDPLLDRENVSIASYFNRDFYRITEITIDFEVEFDSNEWKRYFIENNNAIFHIADSNGNVLKKGPLANREPKNQKWDSITVSAQNFVQSPSIRVRSPPEVEHANWVYVQGNGEHEVIYICESGYYATGDSKVSYSLEKDEWIGLPQCEQLRDATQQYKWPIFLAVPLVVAAFAYFTYWGLRRKEKGSGRTSNDASDTDGMLKEETNQKI